MITLCGISSTWSRWSYHGYCHSVKIAFCGISLAQSKCSYHGYYVKDGVLWNILCIEQMELP